MGERGVCMYVKDLFKKHSHITVNEYKSAGKTDNTEHTFPTKLDLL